MTINKIAVIGVPSSAGARRTGQERAPQSFRSAGFIKRLRLGGLQVVDFGDLPQVRFRPDTQNPKQQNLALVTSVAGQLAEQVYRASQAGMKPIVLGGDCTITIGVVAGLLRHSANLGLIYFDGDVDLNTPATTNSGIFDGMVVAHITGRGSDELTRIGPSYPLLPEENIVLFGYNPDAGWIDPAETQFLGQCSMVKYPLTQIRGKVEEASREAVSQLEDRVGLFLVHFDVDVIDFDDLPVADVPHYHGLSLDETMETLQIFVSSNRFAGLVITEFNADRDTDGMSARRLLEGVTRALAGGHS